MHAAAVPVHNGPVPLFRSHALFHVGLWVVDPHVVDVMPMGDFENRVRSICISRIPCNCSWEYVWCRLLQWRQSGCRGFPNIGEMVVLSYDGEPYRARIVSVSRNVQ